MSGMEEKCSKAVTILTNWPPKNKTMFKELNESIIIIISKAMQPPSK